jgi:protein-disulfide isomerase
MRIKDTLEIFSTLVVTVAAGLLMWTVIETRWLQPHVGDVIAVDELIEANEVRHVRGTGPVVLVEFTDFECPFCRRHARDTARVLQKKLIQAGKLQHVVLNFPLERIHSRARKAGEAAECAAGLGRYWDMHDRLFNAQNALSDEHLLQAAEDLGLDSDKFKTCLSGEVADLVTADVRVGSRLAVNSTPTFFLGKFQPDGSIRLFRRINGAVPLEVFERGIMGM